MTLKRWLSPICLLLALCVALGGQLRAVDAPSLDDTDDDISLSADDGVFTVHGALMLEPPRASSRAVLPALTSGRGRRVIAELFRPPITLVSLAFVA